MPAERQGWPDTYNFSGDMIAVAYQRFDSRRSATDRGGAIVRSNRSLLKQVIDRLAASVAFEKRCRGVTRHGDSPSKPTTLAWGKR
jgi:hypothetical protein